jgi:hypothetical protein
MPTSEEAAHRAAPLALPEPEVKVVLIGTWVAAATVKAICHEMAAAAVRYQSMVHRSGRRDTSTMATAGEGA